ncbi:hypothetical protein [Amycolatopsis orientalis]|uniref:hypothetical protein n=1 Tax=Amycolatopsis orientalis TaxID=31958 RepID=UPI00056ADA9A|nr:hypothetical protein [Amycolatopsis orientalis]
MSYPSFLSWFGELHNISKLGYRDDRSGRTSFPARSKVPFPLGSTFRGPAAAGLPVSATVGLSHETFP